VQAGKTDQLSEVDVSEEIWRVIAAFPSYEVSNIGNVRRYVASHSWPARHPHKPNTVRGYHIVSLSNPPLVKHMAVHRLVATAFINEIPPKMQINHKNKIRTDNRVENLEIVTCVENIRHSYEGRKRPANFGIGPTHFNALYTTEEVLQMRALYSSGIPAKRIARILGFPYAAVFSIVKRRTWAHLP
jgi:hypothetical protein